MSSNKEMQTYIQGMQHALKLVQSGGVQALEQELKYRASNPLPMNVSRAELTACVRMRAKEELMLVATASATTLNDHMKLPPSVVKDYLVYFNKKVEEYHMDPDKFVYDQNKLDRNYAMNETCKSFLKEDNINE